MMKLFCFTYAGGSASFYEQVEELLPKEIEVIKLEYAGHGTRRKEPFYADFDELAEDMYARIASWLSDGDTYALMGYSMGSISVAETLRRVIARGELPLPKYVFLAAHEPQTKAELRNYSSGELDELVKERTVSFGAVPEKLIHNDSFWRMYLPIYRADYSIIGNYRFEDLDLFTTVPVTVFYSEADTPFRDMKEWTRYFVGLSEFIEYTGSHFFIQEHKKEMAEVILKHISDAE